MRGIKMRDEAQAIQPGEFRDVDAPGGNLKDAFMMLPFKEPSATLLQLLTIVVSSGQRFASIADMQVGDGVLFYHSNSKPNAIVGYAVVSRSGYPAHTAWDPKSEHPDLKSTPEGPIWYMVDIKAEALFRSPISLSQVKSDNELKDMVLAKNSRLSVQPVTPKEWKEYVSLRQWYDRYLKSNKKLWNAFVRNVMP